MRPSPKSEMMLYHEGEWELEAHTTCRSSCSTHGYFESWRDELLTPSQCWDSEISCFAHWCWSKTNVNYLGKSSYFCSEFHLSILIEKIWKFSTSSKTKKIEQYCLSEVLRFKFLLESDQQNMICSHDSPFGFLIENVSKSRVSRHAPMGLIIF